MVNKELGFERAGRWGRKWLGEAAARCLEQRSLQALGAVSLGRMDFIHAALTQLEQRRGAAWKPSVAGNRDRARSPAVPSAAFPEPCCHLEQGKGPFCLLHPPGQPCHGSRGATTITSCLPLQLNPRGHRRHQTRIPPGKAAPSQERRWRRPQRCTILALKFKKNKKQQNTHTHTHKNKLQETH